jgi:hypothetical protein
MGVTQEHAPDWAWIASTLIAIFVLAVIANREWLNFRGRRYFPTFLILLMLSWIGVVAGAYYQVRNSPQPSPDPAIIDLQTKLAAALRDRDIAVSQRDAAQREHGDKAPSQSIPQIPPSLKGDEIDARIDAWRSIEEQMNDFSRILADGDSIIANWESNQALSTNVNAFMNNFGNAMNRLSALVGANQEFSDFKVIDFGPARKLSAAISNLYQTLPQLPANATHDAAPYIGTLKREVANVKQWVAATKKIADSSILELTSMSNSQH